MTDNNNTSKGQQSVDLREFGIFTYNTRHYDGKLKQGNAPIYPSVIHPDASYQLTFSGHHHTSSPESAWAAVTLFPSYKETDVPDEDHVFVDLGGLGLFKFEYRFLAKYLKDRTQKSDGLVIDAEDGQFKIEFDYEDKSMHSFRQRYSVQFPLTRVS